MMMSVDRRHKVTRPAGHVEVAYACGREGGPPDLTSSKAMHSPPGKKARTTPRRSLPVQCPAVADGVQRQSLGAAGDVLLQPSRLCCLGTAPRPTRIQFCRACLLRDTTASRQQSERAAASRVSSSRSGMGQNTSPGYDGQVLERVGLSIARPQKSICIAALSVRDMNANREFYVNDLLLPCKTRAREMDSFPQGRSSIVPLKGKLLTGSIALLIICTGPDDPTCSHDCTEAASDTITRSWHLSITPAYWAAPLR